MTDSIDSITLSEELSNELNNFEYYTDPNLFGTDEVATRVRSELSNRERSELSLTSTPAWDLSSDHWGNGNLYSEFQNTLMQTTLSSFSVTMRNYLDLTGSNIKNIQADNISFDLQSNQYIFYKTGNEVAWIPANEVIIIEKM